MRVHLVKKQTIEEYVRENAMSRISFRLWQFASSGVDWNTPQNILKTFGATDLLGKGYDRAVFDIGGNNYRMICHYVFGENRCIYSFVGSALMQNIPNCAKGKSNTPSAFTK